MSASRVSVLMSVYNGEKYLREAVDSILNQTFTDFEYIIIDDCSTDSTSEILDRYTDSRIVRLQNPENLGLTQSLNRGLDVAHGEYIARMDADDISLPGRLDAQAAFMDQHPEIGLLGTNVVHMDASSNLLNNGLPMFARRAVSPGLMPWKFLWGNAIPHPTAMIRREMLELSGLRYDPQVRVTQDYNLWARFIKHNAAARLGDVWLYYRTPPESISSIHKSEQLSVHYVIMKCQLESLLGENLPETGIRALFSGILETGEHNAAFAAGADILIRACQRFLQSRLTQADQQQLYGDTLYYLGKLLRGAPWRVRSGVMLRALWRLRGVLLCRVIVSKIAGRTARALT